jgi:SAM-dependent methyltransferase
MPQLTFAPEIFDVSDIASAKRIILTPNGSTTEERWVRETPYLADLIGKALGITTASLILDYGCGIGRLSKALIERFQCRIVGVDISPSMMTLSHVYVQSDKFFSCSGAMLSTMVERGVRFDGAFSVWVLQHSPWPDQDIALIKRALSRRSSCFVLNSKGRYVPTRECPWVNDGIDVKAMLSQAFRLREEGLLPRDVTAQSTHENSFWATFTNHKAP